MTKQKTIMIVDDEPDVLDYLIAVFEDNGYEAVSVASGIDAFESACFSPPDLITLDITMPGQSGLQTYRDMKNEPSLVNVPIVVISATVESAEQFYAMLNGLPEPEGFFNKPIPVSQVLETVNKILDV